MGGQKLTVHERLEEFFRRLAAAPAAENTESALALICRIIEDVEDEFSGVPKQTKPPFKYEGRMYPPMEDRIVRRSDGSILAQTARRQISIGVGGDIVIIRRGDVSPCLVKKGRLK